MSNIKELFLKLTENTIPFKSESMLEDILPKGFKKDKIGNYFYEIGESETLFTTHLDSYCKKINKVNYKSFKIIDDVLVETDLNSDETEIIATDETTILGGDNKAGCAVLINMINNNISGTYFFFIGEEPILSGGVFGSTMALKTNKEYFKKFKRAIAFDRKEIGSVITRQMARQCCSSTFADALIEELTNQGLPSVKDNKGYYTDSAVFMDVIPEVTNVSVGVWHEHTNNEYVNIKYIEKVAEAALHINWENLPVERKASKNVPPKIENSKKFNTVISKKCFNMINALLSNYGFLCLNEEDFVPEQEMVFSQWHKEDTELSLIFKGNNVEYNDASYPVINFMKMIDPEIDINEYL